MVGELGRKGVRTAFVPELGCESGRGWKKRPPHTVPFGRGKLAEVSADDPLLFGEFKVHDDSLPFQELGVNISMILI